MLTPSEKPDISCDDEGTRVGSAVSSRSGLSDGTELRLHPIHDMPQAGSATPSVPEVTDCADEATAPVGGGGSMGDKALSDDANPAVRVAPVTGSVPNACDLKTGNPSPPSHASDEHGGSKPHTPEGRLLKAEGFSSEIVVKVVTRSRGHGRSVTMPERCNNVESISSAAFAASPSQHNSSFYNEYPLFRRDPMAPKYSCFRRQLGLTFTAGGDRCYHNPYDSVGRSPALSMHSSFDAERLDQSQPYGYVLKPSASNSANSSMIEVASLGDFLPQSFDGSSHLTEYYRDSPRASTVAAGTLASAISHGSRRMNSVRARSLHDRTHLSGAEVDESVECVTPTLSCPPWATNFSAGRIPQHAQDGSCPTESAVEPSPGVVNHATAMTLPQSSAPAGVNASTHSIPHQWRVASGGAEADSAAQDSWLYSAAAHSPVRGCSTQTTCATSPPPNDGRSWNGVLSLEFHEPPAAQASRSAVREALLPPRTHFSPLKVDVRQTEGPSNSGLLGANSVFNVMTVPEGPAPCDSGETVSLLHRTAAALVNERLRSGSLQVSVEGDSSRGCVSQSPAPQPSDSGSVSSSVQPSLQAFEPVDAVAIPSSPHPEADATLEQAANRPTHVLVIYKRLYAVCYVPTTITFHAKLGDLVLTESEVGEGIGRVVADVSHQFTPEVLKTWLPSHVPAKAICPEGHCGPLYSTRSDATTTKGHTTLLRLPRIVRKGMNKDRKRAYFARRRDTDALANAKCMMKSCTGLIDLVDAEYQGDFKRMTLFFTPISMTSPEVRTDLARSAIQKTQATTSADSDGEDFVNFFEIRRQFSVTFRCPKVEFIRFMDTKGLDMTSDITGGTFNAVFWAGIARLAELDDLNSTRDPQASADASVGPDSPPSTKKGMEATFRERMEVANKATGSAMQVPLNSCWLTEDGARGVNCMEPSGPLEKTGGLAGAWMSMPTQNIQGHLSSSGQPSSYVGDATHTGPSIFLPNPSHAAPVMIDGRMAYSSPQICHNGADSTHPSLYVYRNDPIQQAQQSGHYASAAPQMFGLTAQPPIYAPLGYGGGFPRPSGPGLWAGASGDGHSHSTDGRAPHLLSSTGAQAPLLTHQAAAHQAQLLSMKTYDGPLF